MILITKIDCFWWIHNVSRHSHSHHFQTHPFTSSYMIGDYISHICPLVMCSQEMSFCSQLLVLQPPQYRTNPTIYVYIDPIYIYIYIYIYISSVLYIYIAIILMCPWHIRIFPMIANSIVLLLVVFGWTNLHLSQRRSRCFSLLQDWCCCRCFGGGWGTLCSPREILKFMKCMCMCSLYI